MRQTHTSYLNVTAIMSAALSRGIPQTIALTLALTCALPSAAQNDALPSLGDPLSGVISKGQEHELGRQWLRQLRRQTPLVEDLTAKQWLQDLIYTLFPHAKLQGTHLTLVIIDRPELNAFAVPGGIIGINLGLLLYAQDEDELAAVLAHELAHLSQRHFVRQVEQAQKDVPMTFAAMLASALVLANQNVDAGVAGIYSAYGALLQNRLRYSRDLEQEADRIGFSTLQKAGFDPYAMPSMFKRMQFSQRFGQKPPEFLLTHPMTQRRISDSAARAKAHRPTTRKASLAFWWLKFRATLQYRQQKTPLRYLDDQLRQAHPQSDKHAALALIKADMQLKQNQPDQAEKTLLTVSAKEHALFITTQARLLLNTQRSEQALTMLKKYAALYPDTLSLQTLLIRALRDHRQYDQSLAHAQRLTQKAPNEAVGWQQLSLSAEKAQKWPLAHHAKAELFWMNGQTRQAKEQWQRGLELAEKERDASLSARIKQRLDETTQH